MLSRYHDGDDDRDGEYCLLGVKTVVQGICTPSLPSTARTTALWQALHGTGAPPP